MKVNFVLPPIGSSGGIDVIYKYVDLLQKVVMMSVFIKRYWQIICIGIIQM